jgi:hypothetical protein
MMFIILLKFEHQSFSILYDPSAYQTFPKYTLAYASSYKSNRTLSGGNGMALCEAYGSVITFMQVLASGKKDFVTSQNLIFGAN